MQTDGRFFMPAEWEKHERTFIEWPIKDSLVWPEFHNELCEGYAKVAQAIAAFEPVTMIVDEETEEEARKLCGSLVEFLVIPHNDAWMRDNGPTFVWNDKKEVAGINWKFNAWGKKYKTYTLDNEVAPRLLEHLNIASLNVPLVLEGGSIHVDGEGTMLTTQECLLNPNRNPDLSQEEIEAIIKEQIGVEKIIWLKRGLFGDETDGHIDNVACFARPGIILMQTCHDPQDPNYEITKENLELLKQATDARGRKLEIVEIEQPPIRYQGEERLTLSYLNFYFVNDGIILPVFGGSASNTDKKAAIVLQDLFPERQIVTVDGMAIIKEGGNVHCITQQMPAGIRK